MSELPSSNGAGASASGSAASGAPETAVPASGAATPGASTSGAATPGASTSGAATPGASTSGASAAGAPALRCPHLDELRAFCAAADLGSIGRAAQRLHLTQPAMSRRVKSLEQLVGAPLLIRSTRGVSMTPAGQRLYAQAQRLLADAEELTAALGQIRGTGSTVRLAISHTAAEFVMPAALTEMRHKTSAAVEVMIANSRVVKEAVADGRADVAVAACTTGETLAGVLDVPLMDDEICVAVPLSHPWSRRREVSPEELLRTPIVLRDPGAHTRQVIDETLTAHGLRALAAACEVGSTLAAKEAAHELGLPTALSKLALSPADRLETVEVKGLRFLRRFSALCAESGLTGDVRHMVDAFRTAAGRRSDAAEDGRPDSPYAANNGSPDSPYAADNGRPDTRYAADDGPPDTPSATHDRRHAAGQSEPSTLNDGAGAGAFVRNGVSGRSPVLG